MKKTHRPLTMKRYILSKCIIGNGMINGAINAGIFYLFSRVKTLQKGKSPAVFMKLRGIFLAE